MADFSNLKQKAQEVRNETRAGANTADRVGYVLEETVKAIEAEEKRAKEAESKAQEKIKLYHENGTEAASIGTHDRIQLNGTTPDGGKIVDFYVSAKELYALLRVASTEGDYATSLRIDGRTITLTAPDSVALGTRTLNLGNVGSISGAVFAGLRANDNINIKGKTTIAHNIDPGELKVLHRGSPYGFILRTVDNPNDPNGLMIPELLSTDGYSSYKYTFPAMSGEVALKAELDALKARVAALEAKH